jgi:hypothetical protein
MLTSAEQNFFSLQHSLIINELAITTETLQRLSKNEYSWASTNRMKYKQSASTPATTPTATNGINKSNNSRNNNNNNNNNNQLVTMEWRKIFADSNGYWKLEDTDRVSQIARYDVI